MSFASPIFLVTLAIVPLTLIYLYVQQRRKARYAIAFTNLDVLASVVKEHRSWRRWVPVALLLLALATAATAVARPRAHLTVPEQNATIVLVVDVSGSMRANDVKPSRLDAAVAAMQTFVSKVPKQVKIGLVAFSSTAEVLTTPTTDRETVLNGLSYLSPEAGTALGDGLMAGARLAVRSLAAAGVHHEAGRFLPAALVLESDGAQNRGTLTPQQAANFARENGVRIYGVALGTPNGKVEFGFGLYQNAIPVPPDPATVNEVSKITGGQSYTAQTANKVIDVYKTLGSSIGRRTELREITSWFAIATAVFLIAAVAFSRLWSAPLP
ncbi:MAG: VWA domain-containing protein [Actinobacteria bacterium]|nr:VWA domain-containing protein [Actinomycetota bacterium]MBV8396107.1 VWA domain-containing protein [Actinomycetota bacterium]MBV8599894.1 VWA domain-containing protein [Actinomycetota bacterium]